MWFGRSSPRLNAKQHTHTGRRSFVLLFAFRACVPCGISLQLPLSHSFHTEFCSQRFSHITAVPATISCRSTVKPYLFYVPSCEICTTVQPSSSDVVHTRCQEHCMSCTCCSLLTSVASSYSSSAQLSSFSHMLVWR